MNDSDRRLSNPSPGQSITPLSRSPHDAGALNREQRAMREVLPLTDSLRAELPRMLEEHKAIRAATLRLKEVAQAAGNARVVQLTETLAQHALSEEELFYPAAVLVGDLVRARSEKQAR